MKHIAGLADRIFEKRTAAPLPDKPWEALYDVPLDKLKARADAGEADAAFVVGDIYDQGRCGVSRDLAQALEWYYLAEKLGQGDAINNIGSMHHHGDGPFDADLAKARDYYERGAAAGCGMAAGNLARLYAAGQGGLKADQRKAMHFFRKATALGDGNAMVGLGYRYANGEGVTKSPLRALYWYRRAMQAGSATGAHNLGVAYYHGTLVPQDPAKGVALLEAALSGGFRGSAYLLGDAAETGNGTDRDLEEALHYYRRAESNGHKKAAAGIERVLAKMGEELSPAFDPEERLADIRRLIRDPERRFSVQALLLEVARIAEMLVEDKDNPAADRPDILGQTNLIRGFVLWKQSNPEYQGPVETALMIDERHPFMTPQERVSLLTAKAVAAGRRDEWDVAAALHRRALDILNADPQSEDITVLGTMVDLAFCLHEQGEFAEAQRLNAEVLARAEIAFGKEDSRLLRVLANLAQNEFALKRPEQAVILLRRRLAIGEADQRLEVIDTTLRDLAIASFEVGDTGEAEELFRRRIAFAEKNGDHHDIEAARKDLEQMFSRLERN